MFFPSYNLMETFYEEFTNSNILNFAVQPLLIFSAHKDKLDSRCNWTRLMDLLKTY
jgi:hypothetical protein